MTPDVVVHYFLRAGASFRSSDAWKERHTNPDGTSRVLRAGRFGVGALAAFLLGDRISVTTRHVTEEHGVSFDATIEQDVVELRRCRRPVGTTVRIALRDEQMKRLHVWDFGWDWYCLSDPAVVRIMDSRVLDQKARWPDEHGPLAEHWRRIAVDGYSDVQWSFGAETTYRSADGLQWSADHGI